MHAAKHKQEIKFISFEGPSHEHNLLNHFAIPLLAPEKKVFESSATLQSLVKSTP